jgi:hypothetical protein
MPFDFVHTLPALFPMLSGARFVLERGEDAVKSATHVVIISNPGRK